MRGSQIVSAECFILQRACCVADALSAGLVAVSVRFASEGLHSGHYRSAVVVP